MNKTSYGATAQPSSPSSPAQPRHDDYQLNDVTVIRTEDLRTGALSAVISAAATHAHTQALTGPRYPAVVAQSMGTVKRSFEWF